MGATRTTGVDEARPATVAVEHLVAGEIDRVVGCEIGVDAIVELPVAALRVHHRVAAVVFRLLLLDDIRLNGDPEVIGLSGEIRGHVIVLVALERIVAQVAPEEGRHAQFVSVLEGLGHLDDLSIRVLRTEVDGCPHRGGPEVPGLLDGAEHDLVEVVGIGQEFVVVDLDHEGDLVRVLPGDRPQHAEGGGHRVAAALDGKFDDLLPIEVDRILGK